MNSQPKARELVLSEIKIYLAYVQVVSQKPDNLFDYRYEGSSRSIERSFYRYNSIYRPQFVVCAALGRNAKVLYPPPGSDIPIVASTDEITADAQHTLEASHRASDAKPPPGHVAALQQQLITQAVTEQDLLGDMDAITLGSGRGLGISRTA